jgi:hypothetical protein
METLNSYNILIIGPTVHRGNTWSPGGPIGEPTLALLRVSNRSYSEPAVEPTLAPLEGLARGQQFHVQLQFV